MNEYVLHLKDIFHSDFFLCFFKSLHVEGIAEEGKGTISYLPGLVHWISKNRVEY